MQVRPVAHPRDGVTGRTAAPAIQIQLPYRFFPVGNVVVVVVVIVVAVLASLSVAGPLSRDRYWTDIHGTFRYRTTH